MTQKAIFDVSQCLVVSRDGSALGPKIDEVVQALNDRRGDAAHLSVEYADLDNVFADLVASGAHDEEMAQRAEYERFIRQLQLCPLVILDMSFAEASFYCLALRQTLSNANTIALSLDDSLPIFANARFVKDPTADKSDHSEGSGRGWRCINTSNDHWLSEVLHQTQSLEAPQLAAWQHDVRAVNAFKISPTQPKFKNTVYGGPGLHKEKVPNGDNETVVRWSRPQPQEALYRGRPPEIVVWKGDIEDARGEFNVWVNSENTHMEMARFWDRSVSAKIRKLGAVAIGLTGNDRKDALGLELAERIGTQSKVEIGTVFITPTDPASQLALPSDLNGNGVDYIAHVAAVEPVEDGFGFSSGGKIRECVENVFGKLDAFRKDEINKKRSVLSRILHILGLSASPQQTDKKFSSVLFPLIGAGDGGAHVSLVVHQIVGHIGRIIDEDYAREEKNRVVCGKIDRIGLIAYQPIDFAFIEKELENSGFFKNTNPETE